MPLSGDTKLAADASLWNASVLGYPEADGYRPETAVVFSGTPVAAGPTRYKQTRQENINTVPIRCIVTSGQMSYFELWYYRALKAGLLWFTMPLRTSRGMVLLDAHFTIDGYTARFLGGRERPQLSYWEISADLEFVYSQATQPFPSDTIIFSDFRRVSSVVDVVQATFGTPDHIEPGLEP